MQTCTNELTSIGHFRIQLLHGKQVRVFKVKYTLKQHVTFVCVLVCLRLMDTIELLLNRNDASAVHMSVLKSTTVNI